MLPPVIHLKTTSVNIFWHIHRLWQSSAGQSQSPKFWCRFWQSWRVKPSLPACGHYWVLYGCGSDFGLRSWRGGRDLGFSARRRGRGEKLISSRQFPSEWEMNSCNHQEKRDTSKRPEKRSERSCTVQQPIFEILHPSLPNHCLIKCIWDEYLMFNSLRSEWVGDDTASKAEI